MALLSMIFFLGFVIGIFICSLLAWLLWSKKDKIIKAQLYDSKAMAKQTEVELYEAKAYVASLKERAAMVDGISHELASSRHLLDEARAKNGELKVKVASLEVENKKAAQFFDQRLKDLENVHQKMKEAFARVSEESLVKNSSMINESFKQSMEHFFKVSQKDRMVSNENLAGLVKPLMESLHAVDKKVQDLENQRQGAYSGLKEQISGLLKSQTLLQRETKNLSQALNAPIIRGRWGEMQLRRVVELSGLSAHCDFVEQKTIDCGDGILRPDMIITLPKNKKIIVDAKAPLDALVKNESLSGEQLSDQYGQELALALKRHLLSLKKKSYQKVLGESPEFVVLFLPGEAFLHWALLADPTLLDQAAQNEVIIATPITLIALLKAISFGFRQEAIAGNIEEVRHLSQQLIDRINKVSSHFEKLGRSLKNATDCYNHTLRSIDSRVLVTARKLAAIKSVSLNPEEIKSESPKHIDATPKEIKLVDDERDEESISSLGAKK